jgi:hypothetical protein
VIGWLKRLLGREKKPEPGWPRYVFIHVRGKGLTCGGVVNSAEDATSKCEVIVGHLVMQTGQMATCNYWTSNKEAFTPDEQAAFNLLSAPSA